MKTKAFLICLSLLLSVLTSEVIIRYIYGGPLVWRYPQIKHEIVSWGHRLTPMTKGFVGPASVEANSKGFRGPELPTRATPSRRILFLGDSMTFGNHIEYEQTFVGIVERESTVLTTNAIPSFFFNASIMGWATFHERDFLYENYEDINPGLVILCFFVNDFGIREELVKEIQLASNGVIDGRPRFLSWLPYEIIYLLKRSALFTLARNALSAQLQKEETNRAVLSSQLMANSIDVNNDARIKATIQYLDDIARITAQRGSSLWIVHIPSIDTFQGRTLIERDYVKLIKDFSTNHNLKYIDLTLPFSKEGKSQSLYLYPWDNHLSEAGHQLVAHSLLPEIKRFILDVPTGTSVTQ